MPKKAVSRRPSDHDVSEVKHVNIEDAIARGGSSALADAVPNDDERMHTLNLRLPMRVWKQIDTRRKQRAGSVSRNTWIAEAVEDKIEQEASASAKAYTLSP